MVAYYNFFKFLNDIVHFFYIVSEGSESEADSTDGEEEGEPKEKKERRKRGSSHGQSIPLTMDQLADAEVRVHEL